MLATKDQALSLDLVITNVGYTIFLYHAVLMMEIIVGS